MTKVAVRDVPKSAGDLAPLLMELRRAVMSLNATAVSREELKAAGLVVEEDGSLVVPPVGGDLPPPPQPTGLTITVGSGVIFLEWSGNQYPGHAYTEIYRAGTNDFTLASQVGQTQGSLYVDAVGVGSAAYFYWVRFVNVAGRKGPLNDQAGKPAQTALSVAALLDAITEAAENPDAPFTKMAVRAGLFYVANENSSAPMFSVVTAPIMNNGVEVPVGVYMADAWVKNGTITNAKIGNLAVDDAKISELSVSKLKAGSIAVGQWIGSQGYIGGSSGWRINADGTAEFNNVVIRGTVYASAGSFAGSISGATGNFRGQVTGGGFAGYAWPASGQTGFYIGGNGLLLGNANDGRYFQVEAGGNVFAPGFSIVNGNATFNGTINVVGQAGTRRLVITNSQILVFDDANVLRVRLGIW
ncbi:phage tail tip fiber protein [Variovorax sp. 278MFTsu5.1]|uniref:phage tail tip fiber protein n=1 Tax=Variovorax sp. 278MFTsu5.1 TaxID=3158366 RepID=UPI003AAEB47B